MTTYVIIYMIVSYIGLPCYYLYDTRGSNAATTLGDLLKIAIFGPFFLPYIFLAPILSFQIRKGKDE